MATRGRMGIDRATRRRFPRKHLYGATSRIVSFCVMDSLGATALASRVHRVGMVRGRSPFASGTKHFRNAALKIKRLLIPALYLIIVLTMVLFWLTGCTSLQVLNATVSHRCYLRTMDIPYGPDPRQKLDFYLPEKLVPNAKVVVFLWRLVARRQQNRLSICCPGADLARFHRGAAGLPALAEMVVTVMQWVSSPARNATRILGSCRESHADGNGCPRGVPAIA
jgi:hypothetical protein